MNEMEKWLKATPTFDCENEAIKEKAESVTKGQEKVADKAKSLFYFGRDEIKFFPYLPLDVLESYRASSILKAGGGMCIQKAVLLATLARAVGIPARVHFVDIRNYRAPDNVKETLGTNLFPYHGFDELYIDEKWVKVTPTFEVKVCQEHRLFPVEFDGEHDAMLPPRDLDGNPHIDYLQDHGFYENVPLDEIYNAWANAYSTGSRERLRQFIEAQEIPKIVQGT
ncbi:MAG: transglutaminase domain-containing protein [Chloroflexi bacterium]|nr:transglutaminase domain-containing protein [Chloroflexota bacterium]